MNMQAGSREGSSPQAGPSLNPWVGCSSVVPQLGWMLDWQLLPTQSV